MKQKLLDWGFDLTNKVFDTELEIFELTKRLITIRVTTESGQLKLVQILIDRNVADVPNCTGAFSLFTLLWQLGMVEV